MARYECIIVFDPSLDEDGVRAQMERIDAVVAAGNAQREKHDLWGRRQLAYPMKKKTSGIYSVLVFEGPGSVVPELERQLRINDFVLRHIVVAKDKFAPDLTADRNLDDGFSFVTMDAPQGSEEEFAGDRSSNV